MTFKTENILTAGSLKVKEILPLFEACQMVFWYTPPLFSVMLQTNSAQESSTHSLDKYMYPEANLFTQALPAISCLMALHRNTIIHTVINNQ